jgi:hypothetical protein
MEERQSRADRWSDGTQARMGTVEPEWWLRMMCGQLAYEEPVVHYTGVRQAVRRAENAFRGHFGARSRRWPAE